jgi:hypothetical protein
MSGDESTRHLAAAVDYGWEDSPEPPAATPAANPEPPQVMPAATPAPNSTRRSTLMGIGTDPKVVSKLQAETKIRKDKEARAAAKKSKKQKQDEERRQRKLAADAKQKKKSATKERNSAPASDREQEDAEVRSRTAEKRERVRAEVEARQAQIVESQEVVAPSLVTTDPVKAREQTLYMVIAALAVLLIIAIAYALKP